MEGKEGFLPPEPPGPEPDLEGGAQRPPPPPPPQQPSYPPPAYPGWQQPPPGYPPPPPPGYYAWAPPPVPVEPDNGPAVAGFVVSMVSGAVWLFSAGIAGLLTAAGAGVGMFLSRRGTAKVEAGETKKHKDLATAGWWVGIAVVVLSVLSTIAWILLIVLSASSSD